MPGGMPSVGPPGSPLLHPGQGGGPGQLGVGGHLTEVGQLWLLIPHSFFTDPLHQELGWGVSELDL